MEISSTFEKLYLGFITDRRKLSHRVICRVTSGRYAHAFLIFVSRSQPDASCIVECKASNQEDKNGNGLTLPAPLSSQSLYVARHPFSVVAVKMLLPVSPKEVALCYDMYTQARPHVRYAGAQLFANWLSFKTRLSVYRRRSNPNLWTCSEAVVRLLPLDLQSSMFDVGTYRYDEYVPSGPAPSSLYRMAAHYGIAAIAL